MRPAPISPASPTISPRRTVRLARFTTTRFGSVGVGDGPVADLEEHLARVGLVRRVAVVEVAADHPADDPVLVDTAVAELERLDGAAVADDRDGVGDLLDLVELVADHDAGDAAVAQAPEQSQQVLAVALVERGRGLVEDQQLDVLGQRLGDLDQLLLADADVADERVGVLVEAHAGQQLDGAACASRASR